MTTEPEKLIVYVIDDTSNEGNYKEAIRRIISMDTQYVQMTPIAVAPPMPDHQVALTFDAVGTIDNFQWGDMWITDRIMPPISKALKRLLNPYHTSNRYRPAYKNRQIRRWLSGGKFPSHNRVKVKA